MRCENCKKEFDEILYSRVYGYCPKCGDRKYHRELMRERSHKKKSPPPTHRIKPQRGVEVLQPGCGTWDHYTKGMFQHWLDSDTFPKGTLYRIGGVEYCVE